VTIFGGEVRKLILNHEMYFRQGSQNQKFGESCRVADVEFLNREAGAFLDGVTEGGKKLN
jgi:hypothetical protein